MGALFPMNEKENPSMIASTSRSLRAFQLAALLVGLLALAACREQQPHEEVADDGLTQAQRDEIARLEGLGYLGHGGEYDPQAVGVTVWDEELAQPGLNFYLPGHEPMGILMDMAGNELYTWRYALLDAFPDEDISPDQFTLNRKFQSWRRAHLFPNGDVLIIFEGIGLAKIDRHSNLIWTRRNKAHHDLQVMNDGTIYTLTREAGLFPDIHPTQPVLLDYISHLDAEGRELQRVSIYHALEDSEYAHFLELGGLRGAELEEFLEELENMNIDPDKFLKSMEDHPGTGGDIFHTNTLEILSGDDNADAPFLAKGNALISIRQKHVLAIIDLENARAVWGLIGPWRAQHQPTMMTNGHMLLFDNRSLERREEALGASRILEIDPVSGDVVWEFRGTADDPLHSLVLGSVEELPNGNILISDSRGGRALEVSKEHGVVWEFRTPYRFGEDGQRSASVNELLRYPLDYAQWLDENATSPEDAPTTPSARPSNAESD